MSFLDWVEYYPVFKGKKSGMEKKMEGNGSSSKASGEDKSAQRSTKQ